MRFIITLWVLLTMSLFTGCGHIEISKPAKPVKYAFYLAEIEDDESGSLIAVTHPETGKEIYRQPSPLLTNADIKDAGVDQDQYGNPAITLSILDPSAKRLRAATEGHLEKPIVITLDSKVQMVTTIVEPLSSNLAITGNFTKDEARDIARGLMK